MIRVPSLRINKIKKTLPDKRAFFLSSRKIKGSIALEGSMVLPVFLFFMMTVLLSLEIARFQSNVQEALHQAGNKKAFEEYQIRYASCERGDVREYAKEYLDSQLYPYLCVAGGQGNILFRDLSDVEVNGRIELQVEYQIRPFINWIPIGDIRFKDKFVSHSWTGYKGNEYQAGKNQEIYVYVTKTGSKYHMSHECTYLRVQIQMVHYERLPDLRNQSGGKYHPCLKCKPVKGGAVYITADGGSYHSQSDCSSLKRTIYMISLSEAGEYRACSRCGG